MTPCPHAAGLTGRRTVCDDCLRDRKRARNRAWNRAHRERMNRAQREYKRRHPDRVKATAARWRAANPGYGAVRWRRLKADPVALAAYRENARMYVRLRREREGRPMPLVAEHRYPQANRHWVVPVAPVLALVDRWEATTGLTDTDLSNQIGASDKLMHRLRHEQPTLLVTTADRIAIALGSHLELLGVAL